MKENRVESGSGSKNENRILVVTIVGVVIAACGFVFSTADSKMESLANQIQISNNSKFAAQEAMSETRIVELQSEIEKISEKFEQAIRNFDELEEKSNTVGIVDSDVKDVQKDVQNVESDVKDVEVKVQDVETEVEVVKESVKGVESNVQVVRDDVKEVKKDVDVAKVELNENQHELELDQKQLENKIENLQILLDRALDENLKLKASLSASTSIQVLPNQIPIKVIEQAIEESDSVMGAGTKLVELGVSDYDAMVLTDDRVTQLRPEGFFDVEPEIGHAYNGDDDSIDRLQKKSSRVVLSEERIVAGSDTIAKVCVDASPTAADCMRMYLDKLERED